MTARPYSSLGPAFRLLVFALVIAAGQSARGAWLSLQGALRGTGGAALPSGADLLFGFLAIGAGAFFLRMADENTQALAGGERVLPPLTLLRLVQPRFEHPLRELWSRSDPVSLGEPMPGSRNFGLLWGLGLALALPTWAFALVAPSAGRAALLVDAAHQLAIVAACGAALHFALALTRRQDEAWARVRPSVITVPVRLAGATRKPEQAPAAQPAPTPLSTPRSRAPAAPQPPAPPAPPPVTPAPQFAPPSFCGFCGATLALRRCDACGSPALAGSFRVLKSLGGSGGRRTYLADAPDGAQVVLKELSLSGAPDAQALESFAREARTLRELRHPRLPVYVDAFQEEQGARARLYLAYRYLDGMSLQEEIDERRYTEDEVLDLVEEVLEILRHLHGLQPPVIHRDLKPANLVRRRDGTISLIDFGVARDLDRTVHSGTLVGTIGYMPPEQLAGQVDLTCDLYALGATALHLLVRRPPWEFMDGPELRLPKLQSAPTARALLKRLLAPRRAERFSSAREALFALRRLRAGGFRLPRTALAAAGVAAATVAAVALGATMRIETARPVPDFPPPIAQQTPVPPKPAPIPAPVPLAPPPAAAIAVWNGGSLTKEEIEADLRRLPPWLKSNLPWWIQDHVVSMVKRKLLAAEAQKRGLAAQGPERERLLARALLEVESHNEGDLQPARALRKAWLRTTDALYAAAGVHMEQAQIFSLEPERLLGPPPSDPGENVPRGRLEFAARTGLCTVDVEPALARYGGRCEGVPQLSQAMLEPETLQLVDLAPGSVLPSGFYARYTDDFIESRSADVLDAAQRAEESLARADVWLTESTGTISPSAALALLNVVKPALRRCLAMALSQSPGRPVRADARFRVEVTPGGQVNAKTESKARLAAASCARALARPELGGAGSLTFAAEVERKRGLGEERPNSEYRPAPSGGESESDDDPP